MLTNEERKQIEEILEVAKIRSTQPMRVNTQFINRLCKIALASDGLVEALNEVKETNCVHCGDSIFSRYALDKFNKEIE